VISSEDAISMCTPSGILRAGKCPARRVGVSLSA
jgi:hypothetical protein